MTAPSFVSTSSKAYGNAPSSTTVPAPAGIVNGHILLCWLVNGHPTIPPPAPSTGPAGWAKFDTDLLLTQANNTFSACFQLWWKRAASESGNYVWTHPNNNTAAFIDVYSGCKTSGVPLGATSTNSALWTGGGQATALGTSITTTQADSTLLFLGCDWGDQNNAIIAPSGMTKRNDQVILFGADELRATAGATGNRSTLCNSTGNGSPWGVRMVELLGDVPAGGLMKVWNGSAWVEKPVKVWSGSAWQQKPVKFWNGSAWVLS